MIDVREYKANIRNVIKSQGFNCIYLISGNSGIPTKIGIAADINTRLTGMQVGNWVSLNVDYLLWLPGIEATRRVEKELHNKYAEFGIGGEWFNIHYSLIEPEVIIMTNVLYPNMRHSTHSEMLEFAIKKIDAQHDRILARMGL